MAKKTKKANYSEADKKAYLKYRKKMGTKADPFGTWLKKKTLGKTAYDAYGSAAQKVYEGSDKSKRNRRKMASSKKDRP
jgi:hypothetical protein